MIESELKIPTAEEPESKKEKRKKRFFFGLRNRLMALATAGFLTVGAGWARDLSQQLGIEDKKEAISEFVLESEITDAELRDFKNKVAEEEPEFARLAEEYRKEIQIQLDNLEMEIAQHDISGPTDREYDRQLSEAEEQALYTGADQVSAAWVIERDHFSVSSLQSDPEILRERHDFLKKNLDNIFWGIAFLNNSKESRDAAAKFIKPPTIVFKPHSAIARATTIPSLSSTIWQPEITVYPSAFMGSDKQINSDIYTNVLIHELGHAFLAGSGGGKKIDHKMGNDFGTVMDEGRTQDLAYKVVQYLNRHNPDSEPVLGGFVEYDQNLVIAELIESIARTHPDSDFLVDWQLGIIDYKTMLDNLKKALNDMGFSDDIHRAIVDFRFEPYKTDTSLNLLTDLFVGLKLKNINLSEDFIKSILMREGEKRPDRIENIDKLTEELSKRISEKLNNAGH